MVPKLIFFLILATHFVYAQAPAPVAPSLDSSAFAAAFRVLETETGRDSFDYYFQRGREAVLPLAAYEFYAAEGIELAKICHDLDQYQQGMDLLRQIEDDLAAAAYELPDNLDIERQYQTARGYMFLREEETAIRMIETIRPRLDTLTTQFERYTNLLGHIYLQTFRYQLAVDHFTLVLELRRQLYPPNDNRISSVLNNLGLAYEKLRLLPIAERLYLECLQIRRQDVDVSNYRLYHPLNNLGNIYREQGEFFRSILAFREGIDLLEAEDELQIGEVTDLYINLAVTLALSGRLTEAEGYYRQAVVLLPGLDSTWKNRQLGVIYSNLSHIAGLRQEYDQAVELQNRGLAYYAMSIDQLDPDYLKARNNLGVYHIKQEAYDLALEVLLPLQEEMDKAPTRREELLANLYNDIGEAYAGLDQLTEAEAYQLRALALQAEKLGPKDFRRTYTYNQLAAIALRRGQPDRARSLVDEALAANFARELPVTGYGYFEYYLESLLLKAELQDDATRLDTYAIADQVLANIRHELLDVEDKIDFARYVYEVSAGAIATATELMASGETGAVEKVYYFSERTKANVLGQLLTLNQGKAYAGIPADSITRAEDLETTIGYYKLQLAADSDSTSQARFQQELLIAQQEYRQLIADFRERYPRYYALKYEDRPPDLATVRRAIPADLAIVSYFTTDQNLYCLVLTREDQSVYTTPVNARFDNRIAGLRKTITNRLAPDYLRVAQELYPILFPFELPGSITRLLMIPDAKLGQVPFEALLTQRMEPTESPDFRTLPYLLRRFEVSYAPSVSIWYRQTQDARREYTNDLLAYAPVFSDPASIDTYETALYAPLSDNVEVLRSVAEDGRTITPLPGALSEIERIAEVFDRQDRRARAYLFEKASETTFKQDLGPGNRFLHIATHGFVHRTEPDLSGLLFYPDTSASEDHILYSGEIYGLSVNTDLVVLSACETGLGEEVRGEGVLGLSRAFLYAGARNLLVSLWKVQDRATAELMVDFYRSYWQRDAKNYALPLRQAKLRLIESPEYSHPYYWSSFVLIGR